MTEITGRYKNIRKALAMGPTPGPFSTVRSYSPGNQELILSLTYKDEHGITENYCTVRNRLGDTWKTEANAAYIAACDPDTIRALLEERDALGAENARLRAEVERLQEAVRPRREDECLTLDHWRIRAYHLEENWSRCSRACAIEQDKREQAEARAKQLSEALRLAEEHINVITPDWYNAGQQVLAAIRDALSKENGDDWPLRENPCRAGA